MGWTLGIIAVTDRTVNLIVGDPGAASRDDAILSDDAIFLGESLHQEWESPSSALDVNFRPKISHRPD